jgi:hypothetical protein
MCLQHVVDKNNCFACLELTGHGWVLGPIMFENIIFEKKTIILENRNILSINLLGFGIAGNKSCPF